MDLARVLADADRLLPACTELERARSELGALPDTDQELATVDYLLAIVLRGLGQLPVALTHFERAAALFTRVNRLDGAALAERDHGAVLFALGRGTEAAEAFGRAAEASRAVRDEWQALACLIDAAQVRSYAGEVHAVAELNRLREVLSAVAVPDDAAGQAELTFQTARVDHALAHCAFAAGQVTTAAELAERALGGYRTAGADRAVAALSVDAGWWWWQAGDTGSALRYLRGAMRTARELGDGALIARCQSALYQIDELATNGDDRSP